MQLFDDTGYFLNEIPEQCVLDCTHSGDCGNDVTRWRVKLDFIGPRQLAINYLREFGAWTIGELNDMTNEELYELVLWIACCDIREQGRWYGMIH